MADPAPTPPPSGTGRTWWFNLLVAVVTAVVSAVATYLAKSGPPAEVPVPQLLKSDADLDGIPFCGRTETLREQATFQAWPVRRISYNVAASGPTGFLTATQVRDAFSAAWKGWADAIDIEPYWVDDPAKAMVQTKFGVVTNQAGKPDGPLNILAWSELSDGTTTAKHQLFDSAESWGWDERPRQKIDLQRVACHEIGHVLGLVHDDQGADALMQPVYSLTIRGPRSRDIDRMLALGYKRKSATPPPTDPVPTDKPVTIKITGGKVEIDGWTPPK